MPGVFYLAPGNERIAAHVAKVQIATVIDVKAIGAPPIAYIAFNAVSAVGEFAKVTAYRGRPPREGGETEVNGAFPPATTGVPDEPFFAPPAAWVPDDALVNPGAFVESDPDVYVTYHGDDNERTVIDTTHYGYGYGPGWFWGGYRGVSSSTSRVRTYTEVTLIVYIFKAK